MLFFQWFQISCWRRANSDLAISLPFSISTACYIVGSKPYLAMLLLFRAVSAHGSFMMRLEANFISAVEVRQRKTASSGMQSPTLTQIAFLPQIEHGLLESTASLGCVTTLKENGRYLQHFILFNYDHKIPDKLPVEAHSKYLYCTTVSANFSSPGTYFHTFKYKATWAVCKHLPSFLVLQYQQIWQCLLQRWNSHSYLVTGSKSNLWLLFDSHLAQVHTPVTAHWKQYIYNASESLYFSVSSLFKLVCWPTR